MSIFWNAFFGKIVATIFMLVCTLLGFGPDEWIEFVITGLPLWITPKISQYIFLLLALIVFITLLKNIIPSVIIRITTWFNRFLGDIEWFDGAHSIHSFGYTISRPHNLALVGDIHLKGKNTKKSSILIKKAYLRSLVTEEKLDVFIENLKAEDVEISSNINFTLSARFPNEDGYLANNSINGISFESFLKRFSNFEIIIETDSKLHRIEFNSDETQKWISSVHMGLIMPAQVKKQV